jgi:hypothetical protein
MYYSYQKLQKYVLSWDTSIYFKYLKLNSKIPCDIIAGLPNNHFFFHSMFQIMYPMHLLLVVICRSFNDADRISDSTAWN